MSQRSREELSSDPPSKRVCLEKCECCFESKVLQQCSLCMSKRCVGCLSETKFGTHCVKCSTAVQSFEKACCVRVHYLHFFYSTLKQRLRELGNFTIVCREMPQHPMEMERDLLDCLGTYARIKVDKATELLRLQQTSRQNSVGQTVGQTSKESCEPRQHVPASKPLLCTQLGPNHYVLPPPLNTKRNEA
jgi:hypothetical protein